MLAVLDDSEETGWKYIHGDVFRFPPHKNVFCAFVGTGAQVCTYALSTKQPTDAYWPIDSVESLSHEH